MSSTPAQNTCSVPLDVEYLISQIRNDFKEKGVDCFISDDTLFKSIISGSSSNENHQSIRALYTLRNVISEISPQYDEREIAESVCRAISDTGRYSAAAYSIPHPNPAMNVSLITACGVSLIRQIDITNRHNSENNDGLSVTPKALRTGAVQVCGDILSSTDQSSFYDAAIAEGINSAAALPVFDGNDHLLGCLTIYASEKGAFKSNELSILSNISKLLSIFLSLARERYNNYLISLAINKTIDGVMVLNQSGNIVFVNQAALDITKFDYNDLYSCHISIIAPEGTDNLPESLQQAMDSESSWTGRWTAARKTGENFVADVVVSTNRNPADGSKYHFLTFRDATSMLARQTLNKPFKTADDVIFVCHEAAKDLGIMFSSINESTESSELNAENTKKLTTELDNLMLACQKVRTSLGSTDRNIGGSKSKSNSASPTSDIPRGQETILLVDDEPALVDSLTMLLSSLGYQVVGKTSSVSALRDFKSSPNIFDIIITDMTMPEMMGNELIEHVFEVRPDIPVILCSGIIDHTETSLPAGNISIVDKPSRISAIANAIRKALDK